MKLTILATLLMGLSVLAQGRNTNNPKAPIQIECQSSDGQVLTYRVMELYFDSKTGKAHGMGFGPNRGDEGFIELTGACSVIVKPQIELEDSGR